MTASESRSHSKPRDVYRQFLSTKLDAQRIKDPPKRYRADIKASRATKVVDHAILAHSDSCQQASVDWRNSRIRARRVWVDRRYFSGIDELRRGVRDGSDAPFLLIT